MSERSSTTPSWSHSSGASARDAHRLGPLVRELLIRGYALVLVAIVLWLSWRAFYYLVAALILPAQPPGQIVDIPVRLNAESLTRSETAFQGVQATRNPRGPLSHYHRLDNWFQQDRLNACTRNGCHVPLPHGKNKADRAFLNMHATSIHCGVCHVQTEQKPLELAWHDLEDGKRLTQPPALLQAYAWLTAARIRESSTFSRSDQDEIVRLLRAAADQSGNNPGLVNLAEHLAAVGVTSEEFVRLVQVARDTVPRHFRGEYAAKMVLVDSGTKKPLLGDPGNEQAVQDYLTRRDGMSEGERTLVLKKIHPQQREQTVRCTECHRTEHALVDLSTLGYPMERIQTLLSPLVMETIEHIVDGRPFHLPGFLGADEKTKGEPGHETTIW